MVGFSFVCFRSRVERVSFRAKGLGVLCGLDIFAGGGEGRGGVGGGGPFGRFLLQQPQTSNP